MNAIDTAQKYFNASNRSAFKEIEKFFRDSSTYSSENTGLYLGKQDIIKMQKSFHESFEKLNWNIVEIKEEKPGIVRVNFIFSGIKNGEKVFFSGVEYLIVVDEKIQHIEIKNK